MTPLTYFFALAVSALGLGVGIMLAFLAKEELDSIRRYLVLMKKILLGSLLAIVGYIYSGGLGVGVLFFLLGFGLGWFVHEEKMLYLILGASFFVGSLSENLFALTGALILLYGFCTGILLVHNNLRLLKKDKWIVARKAAPIMIIYLVSAGAAFLLKYILKP